MTRIILGLSGQDKSYLWRLGQDNWALNVIEKGGDCFIWATLNRADIC
jgi:hypothetical protein